MFNNEIAVISGKSSKDFGVYLINGNIFDVPVKEVEYFNVPGRSGSLTIDKGRYNNIDITYTFAAYDNAIVSLNAWKDFIQANVGYQRIETSLEPEIYREGVLKSIASPKISIQNESGYMEVVFSCMPQKWLKENDETASRILLTHGLWIHNPTNFDARPLLKVTASQTGRGFSFLNYIYDKQKDEYTYVSIGGFLINTTSTIWIDCQTGDAYSGDTNYNEYVQLNTALPTILGQSRTLNDPDHPGRPISDTESLTTISIDDSYVTVLMYPRWWTL